MAIGPEARRTASGRVVVTAAWYAVLAALSIILGLGPLVRPADVGTRAIAILVIVAGVVMLSGAAGLVFGGSWGRLTGIAAAWAAAAVGSTVVMLALSGLGACTDRANSTGCSILMSGLFVVGAMIIAVAFVAAGIARRSRLGVFRRRRRG